MKNWFLRTLLKNVFVPPGFFNDHHSTKCLNILRGQTRIQINILYFYYVVVRGNSYFTGYYNALFTYYNMDHEPVSSSEYFMFLLPRAKKVLKMSKQPETFLSREVSHQKDIIYTSFYSQMHYSQDYLKCSPLIEKTFYYYTWYYTMVGLIKDVM